LADTTNDQTYDVAVVGLGPVGAIMASLLAHRGFHTLVVEREPDVYPLPRAAHIDHTALHVLQQIGLLDQLIPDMIENKSLDLVDADHNLLVRIPVGKRSISGLPASMYFYQPTFDRILTASVAVLPLADVRRGVELQSIEQTESLVTLTCWDQARGVQCGHQARWLIGCDGANSTVRELIGIELESLGFDERWLVFDLKNTGPASVLDRAVQVCDPMRPHVTNPIPGDRQRFEFRLFDGEDHLALSSREFVQSMVRHWYPDGQFEIERSAVYAFHGLIAKSWRSGRILLAGDAAHQMPPFLGQGLCSGIRDTANLAWKLDFVRRGIAPASILDTYQLERSAHVRTVIEAAVEFGRFVAMTDADAAAERNRNIRSSSDSGGGSPTFKLPNLPPGPLVGSQGGTLFPVFVDAAGGRLEVPPDRLLILVRDDSQMTADTEWLTRSGWASIVSLADLGSFAPDVEKWLDGHASNAVIVRPDQYVLAAGQDLGTLMAPYLERYASIAGR